MTNKRRRYQCAVVVVSTKVTNVVVCSGFGVAKRQRKRWLSPVQRLYLAFLVHTQDQSPVRRIHIQPDNVVDLGYKVGVG